MAKERTRLTGTKRVRKMIEECTQFFQKILGVNLQLALSVVSFPVDMQQKNWEKVVRKYSNCWKPLWRWLLKPKQGFPVVCTVQEWLTVAGRQSSRGASSTTRAQLVMLSGQLLMDFVNKSYLDNILETHPCDTLSCLDMSQGLTPLWASSTILCLTTSGSGLPFTNTPPNWFTPPWPENKKNIDSEYHTRKS